MPVVRQLMKTLRGSPQSLFWAFACAHLLLWTALSSLITQNLPLDVIEGYAWGNEWLLGTHKHPPMQAWILEGLYIVTGRAKWAPYLASQLAVVTAFWAVWQTGRRIAGETVGLLGALILEGIIYYNFASPEFNPNILQLPFWALAGWSFHKAVADNKMRDWLLLGLWAACGLYTKYSTALFLMMLYASLLAHRDGRLRLRSFGPYAAALCGLVLFIPQLHWLMQNNFLPLQYAEGRLNEHDIKQYSALLTTTAMVLGQVAALLLAMFLILLLYNRRDATPLERALSFDRVFLCFAAFGPFAAMFVLSLFFGYHIRDMWETPFWNFFGLWAIVFLRPCLTPHDLRRFALGWALVFSIGLVAYAGNEVLAPYITPKPKRTFFPGKHLSHYIIDSWHKKYHAPLEYVIGDTWPAGNVAWYADDRPHVFMDGEKLFSPWIDETRLRHAGGVIVWCIKCGLHAMPETVPPALQAEFPTAELQPSLTINRMTDADVPPVQIGWALVPPQAH